MRCRLASLSLASAVLCAAAPAAATSSGWAASSDVSPIEQRIAVAVTPSRTTTWSSLRFSGVAGEIAVIVPAAQGAQVDVVSDAWFEALEDATAMRVLPPIGAPAACPGAAPLAPFEIAGHVDHAPTLAPTEVVVIAAAGDVGAWATSHGLVLSSSAQAAIAALGAIPIVAARFSFDDGEHVTSTLRVASPGSDGRLPLSIARAGVHEDMLVTTFVLGEGTTDLTPTTPALLPPSTTAWYAAVGKSDYQGLRGTALAASSETAIVESASHGALVTPRTVGDDAGSIPSAVATYYERGMTYLDAAGQAPPCIQATTNALGVGRTIGRACPVGGAANAGDDGCTEEEGEDLIDPSLLRCADLDDLAVGLGGLDASKVWLTRTSLLVERSLGGPDLYAAFSTSNEIVPVINAGRLDFTSCATSTGTGSGTGDGTGSGNGTGNGNGNGNGHGSGWNDGTGNGAQVDLQQSVDSCSGDTSDSASSNGDSCSGDTSEGASSDSCSGSSDSASSDSCDSSGSSDDSCDGGSSSGDSCSGGGSSDGCGSGSTGSSDCTIGYGKRPRASVLLMAVMALLAPLRRRGTKKRAAAKSAT